VPRRVERLIDFTMSDAQWESLMIPINLAFFFCDSSTEKITAIYPSPAGPMESLLDLHCWAELVNANSILHDLKSDVEALLVNHMGQSRDYYCMSIDLCYELVGIIRVHWRGISGGSEVRDCIRNFFAGLKHD
jgi:hypothetical protein